MAERRMFAKSIVLSDAFLDMPMSARCLYFTLSMFADDDGFVGSPKGIMRQCGASQDDIAVLLQKRYILGFASGVIVIKHWRINNYLRNDRYKETTYIEELSTLAFDDKQSYTEKSRKTLLVSQTDTNGIPTDDQRYTNGIPSIGKDSTGKFSLGEDRVGKDRGLGEGEEGTSSPALASEEKTDDMCDDGSGSGCAVAQGDNTPREAGNSSSPEAPRNDSGGKKRHGQYENVLLYDAELEKLKKEFPSDWRERIESLSAYIESTGKNYKNHLATIRNWARIEKERGFKRFGEPLKPKNCSFTADDVKKYEEWAAKSIKRNA